MSRRTRRWGFACLTGFTAFVEIQFIRPSLPHPAVGADLAAPRGVRQILRTSCYDCHSNETRLAWFDQIVPVYWIVVNDVGAGRRVLNFSGIGRLPAAQQKAMLYEAVDQIQLGAMPLPAYARLHREAVVTPEQLDVLKRYLNPEAAVPAASTGDLKADEEQYEKWIREKRPTAVAPAPKGIGFPADYRNWEAVSTVESVPMESDHFLDGQADPNHEHSLWQRHSRRLRSGGRRGEAAYPLCWSPTNAHEARIAASPAQRLAA